MAISDVMAAVNPKTTTTTSSTGTQATEDRFLKLLVTQMKNQDPLNPLDNAQVTSQMAQLSTVTGIEKLNTSLTSMSDSFQAAQALQAANMVGRNVLASGSVMALASGTAFAGMDLKGNADSVVVSVKDASGAVVRTLDLGAQKAGTVSFQWDGKNQSSVAQKDGTYTFDVVAKQGTEKVTADKLALSSVESVSITSTGVKLNVAGVGAVDATSVKQIF
ncbi:MAG: flagellar hook assembly protein FlgD [Sulfuricella sp.]|nr:flagellar hook assembly protein FlgD [Sulfuricella sp.]